MKKTKLLDKKQVDKEIIRIKDQLVKKFKPEKIILFGSAARGDFEKDSDLDFLVVKADYRSALEVEQKLHSIIDYDIAADFLFLNSKEFSKKAKSDIILKEILKEGKLLYG